jgi:hypothetical protein
VDLFEPQMIPQRRQLLHEDGDAPVDVGGSIGAPTAHLVVEDDLPALLGQALERREVMVSRPRPAVKADERVPASFAFADDAVPRAVPVRLDVPLELLRRHSCPSWPGTVSASDYESPGLEERVGYFIAEVAPVLPGYLR